MTRDLGERIDALTLTQAKAALRLILIRDSVDRHAALAALRHVEVTSE